MLDEAQAARERIFADELARQQRKPDRWALFLDGMSLCAALAGVVFLIYSWVSR